ncbi:hypothetical protein KI811_16605 [Geobacter hydrogenophilus]|uniref:Uncharacterized protein n=1 Tax=Geobacter hydrogenophilus TaxID=40983 RepID=A0A9W6G1S8_9BACT|nr:hypothetical protein [Geobacter hydrogenophilus]MBT0895429.1 hypothetical protein [Geobacter hydrogenophilus]GLI38783.1 hypothetical protein GHYDROH2_22840 [Geobacter hydrogenophilus]
MTNIDTTRVTWIDENLKITHDQLTREEARDWLRFMMRDRESFLANAIYGFGRRRQLEQNATVIPGNEVGDFCNEFILKIQLVNRNRRLTVSFPLFELVGRDVLVKFGLIEGHVNTDIIGSAE